MRESGVGRSFPVLRYNLRTVLVAVALFSAAIGYSQVRRRFILRGTESLKAGSVEFSINSDWRDMVWQRIPTEAQIPVQKLTDGRYRIGWDWLPKPSKRIIAAGLDNVATADRIASLNSRLENIGVASVHVIFVDFNAPRYVSTIYGVSDMALLLRSELDNR